MKRKILSFVLCLCLCVSMASAMTGCSAGKTDAFVIMTEQLDGCSILSSQPPLMTEPSLP